ncbi:hypothetical protein RKK42_12040 [Klebsiella pneumoniae]|nr:hypothetical protein [Klebsiella pneumoniae]
MQYDDMTGVLMQRISRIPLSYRRKAKKPPARAGFSLYSDCRFLSLPSAAALPSMKELSNFLAHFQYQKGNIALFANPHESPYGQKGKLLL